jgi:hypothetical protein
VESEDNWAQYQNRLSTKLIRAQMNLRAGSGSSRQCRDAPKDRLVISLDSRVERGGEGWRKPRKTAVSESPKRGKDSPAEERTHMGKLYHLPQERGEAWPGRGRFREEKGGFFFFQSSDRSTITLIDSRGVIST